VLPLDVLCNRIQLDVEMTLSEDDDLRQVLSLSMAATRTTEAEAAPALEPVPAHVPAPVFAAEAVPVHVPAPVFAAEAVPVHVPAPVFAAEAVPVHVPVPVFAAEAVPVPAPGATPVPVPASGATPLPVPAPKARKASAGVPALAARRTPQPVAKPRPQPSIPSWAKSWSPGVVEWMDSSKVPVSGSVAAVRKLMAAPVPASTAVGAGSGETAAAERPAKQ
jgi:hypothetical protein